MGINIPTKEELVANRFDATSLAKHFGADSIVYLTVDGLVSAVTEGINKDKENAKHKSLHCTACLTGNYPVDLDWWWEMFKVETWYSCVLCLRNYMVIVLGEITGDCPENEVQQSQHFC